MKKKISLFAFILFVSMTVFGQDLPPAPENKAVVYFVRTSSLGFAINFSYFDSTTLIGKAAGTNYVRYECEPGHHLFWVRSENRDYVEADLEAGRIYFIEAIPQMGAIKAQAVLKAIDPSDEKVMKKVFKLMNKKAPETFTTEELQRQTDNDIIQRGLERYTEDKAKGKKIGKLERTAFYTKP
jgi:hypothetical protein